MKVIELEGAALDWAVGKCEDTLLDSTMYQYSIDWAWGGPIIERERIELEWSGSEWWARIKADEDFSGPTPLIAAMRCYAASKLGDEIEVPKEIK